MKLEDRNERFTRIFVINFERNSAEFDAYHTSVHAFINERGDEC